MERAHSQAELPELHFKKSRTMTMPETSGRTMPRTETSPYLWRNSIGADNRYIIRSPTFTERANPTPTVNTSFSTIMPELSSFRPQAVDAQGRPRARAQSRPTSRRTSAVDETPSFARSFHLVDTDVSIYKKMHGDEWRDSPLCLYCFRKHGNFNKLEEYGYEACGRDEALESHYWE